MLMNGFGTGTRTILLLQIAIRLVLLQVPVAFLGADRQAAARTVLVLHVATSHHPTSFVTGSASVSLERLK